MAETREKNPYHSRLRLHVKSYGYIISAHDVTSCAIGVVVVVVVDGAGIARRA